MSQCIVDTARRWIGTPYRHQASTRGAGCDCLGLLRGVWRECFGREPEPVPPYSADWAEPQGHEALLEAALRLLTPARQVGAGSVLIFRMRSGAIAKHVGLAAETGARPTFIHAYSGHGVVESPLSDPWARRIAAIFTFPKQE